MKKIRDGLARIVNGIDKIERFLITVIFTEVIIVGFAQVVCRFILRTPLPWSEELLRFSFIWLTYTASSMGSRAGWDSLRRKASPPSLPSTQRCERPPNPAPHASKLP